MKKSYLYVLILALIFVTALSGCAGKVEPPVSAQLSPAPVTPEATEAGSESSDEPVLGGVADPAVITTGEPTSNVDSPAQALTTSDALNETDQALVNAMSPVFDSQIRYMYEHSIDFIDYSDPSCVWSTLYYLCTNYFTADSRISSDMDNAIVPESVMKEYMLANFETLTELPELPSDSSIKPDTANASFIVPLSDSGDTYTRILSSKLLTNGYIEVQLGYFDISGDGEDALIKAYSFYVAHRSELDASDTPYKLTVSTMFTSYTDAVTISAVEERADGVYVTIEYLDELWHIADQVEPDGTINAYDWLEINPNGRVETVRISPNAEFEASMLAELVGDTVDADMDEAAAREYFIANCTRLLSDMPIYFDANIIDGVLYGADVMFDAYFAG